MRHILAPTVIDLLPVAVVLLVAGGWLIYRHFKPPVLTGSVNNYMQLVKLQGPTTIVTSDRRLWTRRFKLVVPATPTFATPEWSGMVRVTQRRKAMDTTYFYTVKLADAPTSPSSR